MANFSNRGIIYFPYHKENWSRMEFNYEVSINSLGIRDDEIDTSLSHSFVIGDSFVFGEGVSLNDTISKQLSKYCNRSFVNLGNSGAHVKNYLFTYKKSVKHLEPEDVIIVIFVGNDILDYGKDDNSEFENDVKLFNSFMLRDIRRRIKNLLVKNLDNSCDILPKSPQLLNQSQYSNYLKMDKGIYNKATENKECHKTSINPYLVRESLANPNYFQTYINAERIRKTQELILEMNKVISLKSRRVMFVFIPEMAQLGENYSYLYDKLGVNVSGVNETHWIQKEFMDFCIRSGLSCIDMFGVFKNSSSALYWKLDPHLNARGNELIALSIGKSLC